MESLTKNRQSFETIRALAARAYGQSRAPLTSESVSELGHGWFNVAYKVTLADGSVKVLKVAPSIEVLSHEVGAMQTEWAAIELIQKHTDVPVAPVEFKDDSLELIAVPYFFMPFIEGDDIADLGEALTPELNAHFTEEVGKLNYTLNQIVGPGFGPIRDPKYTSWVDAYSAFFEGTLTDGERRGLELGGHSYDRMREIFQETIPYLAEVTEPRYIEQDMWPKAVIYKDGKPLAHIDHERAYFGDPILEAGFVFCDIPSFGDAQAFLKGYGKDSLTQAEAKRRLLYTLHLSIIMVVEAEYRGFDDDTHLAWVHDNLNTMMQRFGN